MKLRLREAPSVLKRPEYRDDTMRLFDVANQHGARITLVEAEQIWIDYSDHLAAGWIILPKTDEELWQSIENYFEPAEEQNSNE